MGHTMEHCDVLRSGHPAETAGLWHISMIPNQRRTQLCFLIAPPSDYPAANLRFSWGIFKLTPKFPSPPIKKNLSNLLYTSGTMQKSQHMSREDPLHPFCISPFEKPPCPCISSSFLCSNPSPPVLPHKLRALSATAFG